MRKIHVFADLIFKENHLEEIKPLLMKMVADTKKEDGCVSYELVEDFKNKGIFFTIEVWESQADLDKHLNSEGIKKMMETAKPFSSSEPASYQCEKWS